MTETIESRNSRMFQGWNEGRTITELADLYGLSRTTVYNILLKKLLQELPKWTMWAEQKAAALGHKLQAPWKMPRKWDDDAETTCALCGYRARITNRLALRGLAVKSKCSGSSPT